jgi:DNA relaxase NicK
MSIHKNLNRLLKKLDSTQSVDDQDHEIVVLTPPDVASMTPEQYASYEINNLMLRNAQGFDERDLSAKLAKLVEVAVPPSNNMGGTPPLPPQNFSHSEKLEVFVSQKTSMDWLGFSTLQPYEAILLALQVIWPDMTMSTSKAGMKGYPKCKALFRGEVQYGLVGYGAAHGRNSVSLPGTACKTIITNEQYEIVSGVLDVLQARLSRVDLCFDFYKGEMTFEYVTWAYENGLFKAANAPHQPKSKVIGEVGPNGENLGRTRYIGPRDGAKYGRIYEKGLEVFAKLPEPYREACTEREQALLGDGPARTIADDWLRLEVEFKRVEKDRPIPMDIIRDRDLYFAGAYPFFAQALGMGEGKGRGVLKSDNQICHDKLIMAHRASYGNHVHTLRRIGFTDTEIADMLDTGNHNQKLLKAGLVVIEQQAVKKYRDEFDPDYDIPF